MRIGLNILQWVARRRQWHRRRAAASAGAVAFSATVGADDNAIVHGTAFANWTIDANSSKSAAGIVIVQTGTSDNAIIDISGLAVSTSYWMKLTTDTGSAGYNGNVRLVALADTGCEIAGAAGVLVNFGGAGVHGTFFAKVTTGSSQAQAGLFRLVLKHATSPDTNWMRITEVNLFPVPARSAAKVAVLGDRSSGYVLATANATDAALVHANADTVNVVSPGDLAEASYPTYATMLGTLRTALIALGGNIFPAVGNHDYLAGGSLEGWKSYFSRSATYYRQVLGEMEFFFYDTNDAHADNDQSSLAAARAATMGQWLINALAASTARWKIVVLHHSVYTSSSHSSGTPAMAWDWPALGAAVVVQSHDHVAERLHKDGACYYTVGLGGAVAHAFGSALTGSMFRSTTRGYLKIYDSTSTLVLEYYDNNQLLLDRVKITRN